MKRISVFYTLLVIVSVAAILGVLRLGSSLDLPPSSTAQSVPAIAHQSAETDSQDVTSQSSFLDALRANLEHPLSRLFVQLLVIVIASRITGWLFNRFGQPAVVGEMAAGILLGPSLFGWLSPQAFATVFPDESMPTMKLLSQIGVCFFMFAVGMEVNVKQLRSQATTAVAVSHASILFSYVLGVLLAYFLYKDLAPPDTTFMPFALFMGISMSISAFPVLARILQERDLTRTPLGSAAITCAAFGDVTAWSILAFVVAIAKSSGVNSSLLNLVMLAMFVLVMLLGVRRVLPGWIGSDSLAAEEPPKATLAAVVCLVMAAALFTETIGINVLFGAFLAGAIMPETHDFRRKISQRVESFSSVLLLPLFFTFSGLRTQIGLLDGARDWMICLLIIAIATLGKLGGTAVAARLTGMTWRESLALGALMNTRGLIELVALNIGYDLGILSPRVFTMLVIMALVTTALAGPLLTLFDKGRPSHR